jgi:hypothetical protein
MELTISQIEQLEAGKKSIRSITPAELQAADTDISTFLPRDVYTMFRVTLEDELGHLLIGEPELVASHLEISSIDGQMLYKKPAGTDNRREFFQGRSADEKLTVGVKYNRVQVRVKVGLEQEWTDTFFMNYALDRSKCQFAHGKTISIADTIVIMREEDVFRSTPKEIGPSVDGLRAHLANFEGHSQLQNGLLGQFRHLWLGKTEINQMLADHHLRASLIAHGMRRGIKQVVDDNTLKAAHFLMYHSEHPYALSEDSLGMSTYDLFCCFTEGLKVHNKDLVATLDKQLNLFRYFHEFTQTYDTRNSL